MTIDDIANRLPRLLGYLGDCEPCARLVGSDGCGQLAAADKLIKHWRWYVARVQLDKVRKALAANV